MSRKPVKKWKRILRRILTLLAVLALLAGAGWIGYSKLKMDYTVTYDAYTASIGSISNALSFSGSFALVDTKTYMASSASTVRNLYVSAGDKVTDGQKLMRLANGETMEADFDGRINVVNVSVDDDVMAGDALIQLADFSHMKVSVRVDEYDIADVSVGQACTVTATATEREFESEIASIDYISSSSGSVAYYTAVAYVDVDDGIYPGMQVTLSIPQEEADDVVVLKMDALSFDEQNNAYVWMYDDQGELKRVDVEVGVSNGNYVEIVSGLSEGDEVFVEVEKTATSSGLSGLLSGMFGSRQMNGNMDRRNFGQSGSDDSSERPDFSNMTPPGGEFGGENG